MFPIFSPARIHTRETCCLNNQRQLAIAVTMYVQDNGEVFFPNTRPKAWTTYLKDYLNARCCDCPSYATARGDYATPEYGFNRHLYGTALGDVVGQPQALLLTADLAPAAMHDTYVFTATSSRIATDYTTAFAFRHQDRRVPVCAYSCLDGHVALLQLERGATVATVVKEAGITLAPGRNRPPMHGK
jgi:hypothetical protein